MRRETKKNQYTFVVHVDVDSTEHDVTCVCTRSSCAGFFLLLVHVLCISFFVFHSVALLSFFTIVLFLVRICPKHDLQFILSNNGHYCSPAGRRVATTNANVYAHTGTSTVCCDLISLFSISFVMIIESYYSSKNSFFFTAAVACGRRIGQMYHVSRAGQSRAFAN